VAPSRGASSAADWAANKTITSPDFRGCALAGLDDMGNTAAGRLTAAYFGTAATVLGAVGGGESIAPTVAQMPPHYHSASIYDPMHNHSVNNTTVIAGGSGGGGVGGGGNFGHYRDRHKPQPSRNRRPRQFE
jgi:hypothetical protein